jgi:hypothetical protein
MHEFMLAIFKLIWFEIIDMNIWVWLKADVKLEKLSGMMHAH